MEPLPNLPVHVHIPLDVLVRHPLEGVVPVIQVVAGVHLHVQQGTVGNVVGAVLVIDEPLEERAGGGSVVVPPGQAALIVIGVAALAPVRPRTGILAQEIVEKAGGALNGAPRLVRHGSQGTVVVVLVGNGVTVGPGLGKSRNFCRS